MKTCSKCGIEKSPDEFYKHPSCPNGLGSCKSCKRSYQQSYKIENIEKIRKKDRIRCFNNKEKKKEYDKKYCFLNADLKRKQRQNWKNNNRDKHRELGRLSQRRCRENLTDGYVRMKLKKQIGDFLNDIPKELIQAKKEVIKLHRLIKQKQ